MLEENHDNIRHKNKLFLFVTYISTYKINPLNAVFNPIRHLLTLVGARHIVYVSGIRDKKHRVRYNMKCVTAKCTHSSCADTFLDNEDNSEDSAVL